MYLRNHDHETNARNVVLIAPSVAREMNKVDLFFGISICSNALQARPSRAYLPTRDRLIVIEDAPEIRLDHPNSVGLIAVRGDQGEAQFDADDLLRASLRMRPDRVLLGELRGKEAFAFLRAVNSGHPGSLTTVHADTPEGAVDQIALLAMTSGLDLGWDKIHTYVRRVIDVVVQLDRQNGKRRVCDIRFLAGDHAVPPAAND
jgi:Flp pilus assembly CpaF family ATPase